MKIDISQNARDLGSKAGSLGVELLKQIIAEKGSANIILATGASQFHTIDELVKGEVDWSKVTMFHLDEYIGINDDHPASFQKYLRDRFLSKINNACTYYLLKGDTDPVEEADRMSKLIAAHPIDMAFIGIGENGHLAFNDPPADFETVEPYLVVELDEACRQQQFGEGWFEDLESVPKRAISMSIQQILKSTHLIVSVPDERKAAAVQNAIEGPLSNLCPASILRQHQHCHLFLDAASASKVADIT